MYCNQENQFGKSFLIKHRAQITVFMFSLTGCCFENNNDNNIFFKNEQIKIK